MVVLSVKVTEDQFENGSGTFLLFLKTLRKIKNYSLDAIFFCVKKRDRNEMKVGQFCVGTINRIRMNF